MNLESFSNAVLREVLDMVGRSFDVNVTEIPKNNGVAYPALSAVERGENGGASIPLDGYFEEYRDRGTEAGEAARDVCRMIMEHRHDHKSMDLSGTWKWETARSHIYAKLVNREMNRGSLAEMPHRDFLDLAVVYYVEVDSPMDENRTPLFMVHNQHMAAWGQDEETLYRTACSNMRACKQPLFEDMNKAMREMMEELMPSVEWEDLPDSVGYVLTNRKKLFGAAELLDDGALKEIGDKLGSDYVVLPSSVHECVVIPSDDKVSYRELADIVYEINRSQTVLEERLSDHVYLYKREEGELKIAA